LEKKDALPCRKAACLTLALDKARKIPESPESRVLLFESARPLDEKIAAEVEAQNQLSCEV